LSRFVVVLIAPACGAFAAQSRTPAARRLSYLGAFRWPEFGRFDLPRAQLRTAPQVMAR